MRKFIALLLFVFPFLPLACGALGLLAVNSWLLDRSFYTSIADDSRLYNTFLDEDLPAYLMQDTISSGEDFPAAALAAGLQTVVTPDYLRDQAVGVINDIFDYIDGKTTTLNTALDLTPIKTALADPEGRANFASAVAENLAPCASGQSVYSVNSKFPVCIPAGETSTTMTAQIEKALPSILETLPPSIALNSATTSDPEIQDGISALRWGLSSGIVSLAFAAAVVGALLGLIGGDGPRGKLRWMGVALLIPALMILGLGLAMNQSNVNWLNPANTQFQINGETIQEFDATALALFQTIFQRVGSSFTNTGILAAVGGLALVLFGVLLPGADGEPRRGRWVDVPSSGPVISPEKPKTKQKPIYDGDDSLAPGDDDLFK